MKVIEINVIIFRVIKRCYDVYVGNVIELMLVNIIVIVDK